MSDFKDTEMILEMVYNGLYTMKKQAEKWASSVKEEDTMYHQGYIEALIDASDYVWRMRVCCSNRREIEKEEIQERFDKLMMLRGADEGNSFPGSALQRLPEL